MSTRDEFQRTLDKLFANELSSGASTVTVKSGDLHKMVGGYPGPDHRMPVCCSVMRDSVRAGDMVVSEPPSGQGATLTIRYNIPR